MRRFHIQNWELHYIYALLLFCALSSEALNLTSTPSIQAQETTPLSIGQQGKLDLMPFILNPKYGWRMHSEALDPRRLLLSPSFAFVRGFDAIYGQNYLSLAVQSYYGAPYSLLYLDFEADLPELLQSFGSYFAIEKSSYVPLSAQDAGGHAGSKVAYFHANMKGLRKHRQGIQVHLKDTENYLKLSPDPSFNDLTIEMWLQPRYFYRKTVLLHGKTFPSFSGKTDAAELWERSFVELSVDEHGYTSLELSYPIEQEPSLFQGGAPPEATFQTRSLRIRSYQALRLKEWQHLAFSFEKQKGCLSLYINGIQQDRHCFKTTGRDLRKAPLPLLSISIAPYYTGFIDEFRISSRSLALDQRDGLAHKHFHLSPYASLYVNRDTQRIEQSPFWVQSDVQSIPEERKAKRALIAFNTQEPQESAIALYVRSSNHFFDAHNTQVPWKKLSQKTQLLGSLRYYQWRAQLIPNASGSYAPKLYDVQLYYRPSKPLTAPRDLRVRSASSKKASLCLEWNYALSDWPQEAKQSSSSGYGFYIHYSLFPRGDSIENSKPGSLGKASKEELKTQYQVIHRLKVDLNLRPYSSDIEANFKQGEVLQPGFSCQEAKLNTGTKLGLSSQNLQEKQDLAMMLPLDNAWIRKNQAIYPEMKLPMLHIGHYYYFSVSAFSPEGESELSPEVHWRLGTEKTVSSQSMRKDTIEADYNGFL